MYWTNYSENILLRTLLGVTAVAPTELWAAAFLSNPGNTGGGTEISYTGYERQSIEFSTPAVAQGSATITNVADVPFPASAAAAGTITHFALMDSQTGGNMLAYITLDEPIPVTSGVAPLLLATEWNYTSSGNASSAFRVKMLNWLRGVDVLGFIPHIALFNGNPDAGGAELAGGAYARFAVSFGNPEVQSSGQSMITNNDGASSPRATSAWGTWQYTAIYDAMTGGEAVAYANRGDAKIVGRNMAIFLEEGELSLSLN